ncbi:uncharacterized protein LOC118437497 [Folsomia candida]|uniref:uncharacterized protein LOC118437497 n=1 Tax=Folsomia candida TaxID=158441 RepID=UPI001604D8B0|nr:uncharacterized protein LOC118437497 [Folsomia candida]
MHICDKFSDRIQILKLCIEGGNSLKPIFQVLKNCCPNLKQLRIEGKFIQAKDLDLFSPGELPKKPNLTLFSLTCWNFYPEIEFVTALANFIQLVVKASPNLKVVTIPWGFYPNLPKSKHLESLTIALDNVYPSDVADTQNVSKLLEMLRQVDNHLVNLCFGTDQNQYMLVPSENYDFKKFRFRLSRRMPKLRKFSNRIVEMFQCADFLQNIEMMPSVETLLIGRELKELRSVDEILRGICDKKMILAGVRKLELIELYDPRLLDGVATAFPNVEALEMNRLWVTDFEAEVTRLEVDVILEGCRGWGRLKRLKVTLPKYPTEMGAFIQALLQGRELFQRLATLEINTYDGDFGTYELSEVEMDMFKQLLLEMDGMDRVTIHKISFGEDLVENILTFMESNNLDVGKFRLYDGSPYRVGD